MTAEELRTLKQRMKSYLDEELVQMLDDPNGYVPEALKLAEAELRTRGYVEATVEERRHRRDEEFRHGLASILDIDAQGECCHLCQDTPAMTRVQFGMAMLWSERVDDGDSGVASDAVAVLTLLTIGVGLFSSGQRTTGSVITLHLRLCEQCHRSRQSRLHGLDVAEYDCCCHPAWERARDLGFRTFVSPRNINRALARPG